MVAMYIETVPTRTQSAAIRPPNSPNWIDSDPQAFRHGLAAFIYRGQRVASHVRA